MNNRQLQNLMIFVAIIFVVAAIFTVFYNRSQNGTTQQKILLTSDQENKVGKVQVAKNQSTITVQKQDESWKVLSSDQKDKTFDADSTEVATFLDNLSKANVIATASTNPNNYSLFAVDDNSGRTVTISDKDGNMISKFVAGKSTTSGNYLRFDGDPNVYIVDQTLDTFTNGSLNDFRDKTLSFGDLDKISQLVAKDFELDQGGESYVFKNRADKVDTSKTKAFLGNFTNLKANSFVADDQAKNIDGKTPDLTFKISFTSGSNYQFEVYKIDDSTVYVKRDKDGGVLSITKDQFDEMNKGVSDLKQG